MNLNGATDQNLVERILQGETKAFSALIGNTKGLVSQIVHRMIGNVEDRKDIAQEIYIKVFHNLSSFRFHSKLSTWIGQIAYRTCLNYLEKKKLVLYSMDRPEDSEELITGKAIAFSVDNLEEWLQKKQLSQILDLAVEKLPPLYRTIIILFHQEELTYNEIQEITDLPSGTLKNYLYRARKKLKADLLAQYKKEDL